MTSFQTENDNLKLASDDKQKMFLNSAPKLLSAVKLEYGNTPGSFKVPLCSVGHPVSGSHCAKLSSVLPGKTDAMEKGIAKKGSCLQKLEDPSSDDDALQLPTLSFVFKDELTGKTRPSDETSQYSLENTIDESSVTCNDGTNYNESTSWDGSIASDDSSEGSSVATVIRQSNSSESMSTSCLPAEELDSISEDELIQKSNKRNASDHRTVCFAPEVGTEPFEEKVLEYESDDDVKSDHSNSQYLKYEQQDTTCQQNVKLASKAMKQKIFAERAAQVIQTCLKEEADHFCLGRISAVPSPCASEACPSVGESNCLDPNYIKNKRKLSAVKAVLSRTKRMWQSLKKFKTAKITHVPNLVSDTYSPTFSVPYEHVLHRNCSLISPSCSEIHQQSNVVHDDSMPLCSRNTTYSMTLGDLSAFKASDSKIPKCDERSSCGSVLSSKQLNVKSFLRKKFFTRARGVFTKVTGSSSRVKSDENFLRSEWLKTQKQKQMAKLILNNIKKMEKTFPSSVKCRKVSKNHIFCAHSDEMPFGNDGNLDQEVENQIKYSTSPSAASSIPEILTEHPDHILQCERSKNVQINGNETLDFPSFVQRSDGEKYCKQPVAKTVRISTATNQQSSMNFNAPSASAFPKHVYSCGKDENDDKGREKKLQESSRLFFKANRLCQNAQLLDVKKGNADGKHFEKPSHRHSEQPDEESIEFSPQSSETNESNFERRSDNTTTTSSTLKSIPSLQSDSESSAKLNREEKIKFSSTQHTARRSTSSNHFCMKTITPKLGYQGRKNSMVLLEPTSSKFKRNCGESRDAASIRLNKKDKRPDLDFKNDRAGEGLHVHSKKKSTVALSFDSASVLSSDDIVIDKSNELPLDSRKTSPNGKSCHLTEVVKPNKEESGRNSLENPLVTESISPKTEHVKSIVTNKYVKRTNSKISAFARKPQTEMHATTLPYISVRPHTSSNESYLPSSHGKEMNSTVTCRRCDSNEKKSKKQAYVQDAFACNQPSNCVKSFNDVATSRSTTNLVQLSYEAEPGGRVNDTKTDKDIVNARKDRRKYDKRWHQYNYQAFINSPTCSAQAGNAKSITVASHNIKRLRDSPTHSSTVEMSTASKGGRSARNLMKSSVKQTDHKNALPPMLEEMPPLQNTPVMKIRSHSPVVERCDPVVDLKTTALNSYKPRLNDRATNAGSTLSAEDNRRVVPSKPVTLQMYSRQTHKSTLEKCTQSDIQHDVASDTLLKSCSSEVMLRNGSSQLYIPPELWKKSDQCQSHSRAIRESSSDHSNLTFVIPTHDHDDHPHDHDDHPHDHDDHLHDHNDHPHDHNDHPHDHNDHGKNITAKRLSAKEELNVPVPCDSDGEVGDFYEEPLSKLTQPTESDLASLHHHYHAERMVVKNTFHSDNLVSRGNGLRCSKSSENCDQKNIFARKKNERTSESNCSQKASSSSTAIAPISALDSRLRTRKKQLVIEKSLKSLCKNQNTIKEQLDQSTHVLRSMFVDEKKQNLVSSVVDRATNILQGVTRNLEAKLLQHGEVLEKIRRDQMKMEGDLHQEEKESSVGSFFTSKLQEVEEQMKDVSDEIRKTRTLLMMQASEEKKRQKIPEEDNSSGSNDENFQDLIVEIKSMLGDLKEKLDPSERREKTVGTTTKKIAAKDRDDIQKEFLDHHVSVRVQSVSSRECVSCFHRDTVNGPDELLTKTPNCSAGDDKTNATQVLNHNMLHGSSNSVSQKSCPLRDDRDDLLQFVLAPQTM